MRNPPLFPLSHIGEPRRLCSNDGRESVFLIDILQILSESCKVEPAREIWASGVAPASLGPVGSASTDARHHVCKQLGYCSTMLLEQLPTLPLIFFNRRCSIPSYLLCMVQHLGIPPPPWLRRPDEAQPNRSTFFIS